MRFIYPLLIHVALRFFLPRRRFSNDAVAVAISNLYMYVCMRVFLRVCMYTYMRLIFACARVCLSVCPVYVYMYGTSSDVVRRGAENAVPAAAAAAVPSRHS